MCLRLTRTKVLTDTSRIPRRCPGEPGGIVFIGMMRGAGPPENPGRKSFEHATPSPPRRASGVGVDSAEQLQMGVEHVERAAINRQSRVEGKKTCDSSRFDVP